MDSAHKQTKSNEVVLEMYVGLTYQDPITSTEHVEPSGLRSSDDPVNINMHQGKIQDSASLYIPVTLIPSFFARKSLIVCAKIALVAWVIPEIKRLVWD
jgi:hypothetical protein